MEKEQKKAAEEMPEEVLLVQYKGHTLTDKGLKATFVSRLIEDREFGRTVYYMGAYIYGDRPKKIKIEDESIPVFVENLPNFFLRKNR